MKTPLLPRVDALRDSRMTSHILSVRNRNRYSRERGHNWCRCADETHNPRPPMEAVHGDPAHEVATVETGCELDLRPSSSNRRRGDKESESEGGFDHGELSLAIGRCFGQLRLRAGLASV